MRNAAHCPHLLVSFYSVQNKFCLCLYADKEPDVGTYHEHVVSLMPPLHYSCRAIYNVGLLLILFVILFQSLSISFNFRYLATDQKFLI